MLSQRSNFNLIILFSGTVITLVTFISLINRTQLEDYNCKDCNVIILDIDILRADALPCYGYKRNTASNICSIADKGILFEQNYGHSPFTIAGVASTMTSLYPSSHKVIRPYIDRLDPQIPTLAELFKKSDYNTTFVVPSGIDVNNLSSINFFADGFEKGFEFVISSPLHKWSDMLATFQKAEKPFFVYLHTQRLHTPYTIEVYEDIQPIESLPKPQGYPQTESEVDTILADYLLAHVEEIFTDKAIRENPELFEKLGSENKREILNFFFQTNPSSGLLKEKRNAYHESYYEQIKKGGKPSIEYMRMMYDTNVAYVDREIKPIIDYAQLSGNTILVIMSQHGEEFGEHGDFGHHSLYNENLHTPLIIYAPGLNSRRVKNITQNIDLFPTLLQMIGENIPEKTQGESLVTLFGREEDPSRYAISEIGYLKGSIQGERWKLIANTLNRENQGLELFDLKSDSKEQNNLADQYQEIAQNLYIKLTGVLDESRKRYEVFQPNLPNWIDDEKQKELIEKGYF